MAGSSKVSSEVRQLESRVELSRVIAAPASRVFELITDPAMHVEIDGSGMLMAAPDPAPMRAVGDHFDMDMDREALGDIPLGKYKVRNTVTRFERDKLFEWNVGGVDQPPFGHVYGYELASAGDENTTRVTLYVDWTGVRQSSIRDRFPIVPVTMLEQSMSNLANLATR